MKNYFSQWFCKQLVLNAIKNTRKLRVRYFLEKINKHLYKLAFYANERCNQNQLSRNLKKNAG
jgi:hypothetical protein